MKRSWLTSLALLLAAISFLSTTMAADSNQGLTAQRRVSAAHNGLGDESGGKSESSILGFTFSTPVAYAAGSNPTSVYAADLDGDNDLDLAIADYYLSAHRVTILKNNGSGSFEAAGTYNVRESPYEVIAVDIDSDNDLDLVSANTLSGNVCVLKNNGNGSSQTPVNYAWRKSC